MRLTVQPFLAYSSSRPTSEMVNPCRLISRAVVTDMCVASNGVLRKQCFVIFEVGRECTSMNELFPTTTYIYPKPVPSMLYNANPHNLTS